MPDRIIRDELIDSDRYSDLSTDTARLLFVHLLLLADDLGNVDAGDRFIRRRALPSAPSELAVTKILSELADHDLIRLYQVDGKSYAHIPRFRQRLRSMKRGHPRPPANIECREIRQMLVNLSDKCPTSDGQATDKCQSLVAEGRKEEKEEKEDAREKFSLVFPDWLPKDAWKDFVAMRRRARAPFTDRAAQMILSELGKLRDQGHDPVAALNRSTMNGWKGVFPPSQSKSDAPNGSQTPRNLIMD